jgi:hypothetical protein
VRGGQPRQLPGFASRGWRACLVTTAPAVLRTCKSTTEQRMLGMLDISGSMNTEDMK